MTLEEMWQRLAAHQPFADERGYGVAWARMCEERTPEAARIASNAESCARSAACAAADAATHVALAVLAAAHAVRSIERSEW